jgi:uncharacterized membrane protein YdjX (TVP38/TMEM64 family)
MEKRRDKPSAAPPGGAASPPPSRRRAHHLLLFGRRRKPRMRWLVVGTLAVLVALAVAWVVLREFDWAEANQVVSDWIGRMHPAAVLPMMSLLPVFGFPIVFVYIFAGARFGPVLGGLVVAGVTAVHLILSYAIANSFLRGPLQRFIERRHHHLPQVPRDEEVGVAFVAALVPGLPYVVRNYALALSGVRFRVYFWVCLPVYVAKSYVSILLGNLSSDPTRKGLIIIVLIDVLKIAICAGIIWWLRWHHRKYHGHPAPEGSG